MIQAAEEGRFALQAGWQEGLSLPVGAEKSASGQGNLCKSRFTEKMRSSFWRRLITTLWEIEIGSHPARLVCAGQETRTTDGMRRLVSRSS